jgi:hypothetical protein
MTTTDTRERRTDALTAARRKDSAAKTTRSLAAVERLHRGGRRVTFAGVAREAQVSGWFVYNQPDVRAAVDRAIADQVANGVTAASVNTAERVSAASLATELAHARAEIRDMIEQRDRYRERARLALGTELEAITQQQLVDRISELETANLQSANKTTAERVRANEATDRAQRLQAELDGARLSLRRMMRDQATSGQ